MSSDVAMLPGCSHVYLRFDRWFRCNNQPDWHASKYVSHAYRETGARQVLTFWPDSTTVRIVRRGSEVGSHG